MGLVLTIIWEGERATNLLAKFDTEILVNGSQIPAVVIDFILFIR